MVAGNRRETSLGAFSGLGMITIHKVTLRMERLLIARAGDYRFPLRETPSETLPEQICSSGAVKVDRRMRVSFMVSG